MLKTTPVHSNAVVSKQVEDRALEMLLWQKTQGKLNPRGEGWKGCIVLSGTKFRSEVRPECNGENTAAGYICLLPQQEFDVLARSHNLSLY